MTTQKQHRIYPSLLVRAREMRHPQTLAESKLWAHLRAGQLGFKFRRQHPIDRFIEHHLDAVLETVVSECRRLS
jgi:very-short-patch-repair endonuclease